MSSLSERVPNLINETSQKLASKLVECEKLEAETNNNSLIDSNANIKQKANLKEQQENEKQTGDKQQVLKEVNATNKENKDKVFTLKKWNLVAMWSWDVECEVCAICRTHLMGNFSYQTLESKHCSIFCHIYLDSCLKCQTDNKHEDCVGK